MESLYHFVLLLDVVLDFVKVVWGFAEVLLQQVVDGILILLGHRQDVFDGVGDDEVFV